jgi:hypothetical protein
MSCREAGPTATRILAEIERQRVRDAAPPMSPSTMIVGELRSLSDADLKCIANDWSWSADHSRREQATLVLMNRRNREFWERGGQHAK